MQITFVGPEAIGKLVRNFLMNLEMVVNPELGTFTYEVKDKDPQTREGKGRKYYKATEDTLKNAEGILKGIGETTMKGVLLKEIIDATNAGQRAIERNLREKHGFKPGSSQRAIGDLCRDGIVDSVDIVDAEIAE